MPGLLLTQSNVSVAGLAVARVVQPTGFSLTLSRGTATVQTSLEPIFQAGVNTTLYAPDFNTYTDATSMQADGWGIAADITPAHISFPAGQGRTGGKPLRFDWQSGEGWLGAEKSWSTTGAPRVNYATWWYKSMVGFQYVGPNPDQQGNKWFITNNGVSSRITFGLNTDLDISDANGALAHEQPSVRPWGAPPGLINHLTDGDWHRQTVENTAESSNGANDGRIRMWIDGFLLFDLSAAQNCGDRTTDRISNMMIAGTFNGGSPQAQWALYDDVRIWY